MSKGKNAKKTDRQKILVGSPVYQKPEILKAFLNSLLVLKHSAFDLDYMFVDDNLAEESSRLLEEFKRDGCEVIILPGEKRRVYECSEESHHWDDSLMQKVADFKNRIIDYALIHDYDALFFVDSDLILHPGLIEHLWRTKKEVVSEIFWTQWHPGYPLEPNVWLFDEYDLVPKHLGETVDEKDARRRTARFFEQLKSPGVYEVGGLGACTLISRSALLKGVNFSPIRNLTIHGEDRFFCIRAAVLGIGLFVDTCHPAYHIYRETDLEGVSAYQKTWDANPSFVRRFKEHGNQITLSMVVHNEENHYLNRVLGSLRDNIDAAVIIDDASTDDTVRLCRELLAGIPLTLIQNQESMFSNEVNLRKKQWETVIATNPDWILNLDADEEPEERFWEQVRAMADNPAYDRYSFRLYDMWDDTHYREDQYWNAHCRETDFFIRYQPDFSYEWKETPQHCGRFPRNITELPGCESGFRIQHFGWAMQEDRERKYKRYQLLDADAHYGVKEQYDSILDETPRLIAWAKR